MKKFIIAAFILLSGTVFSQTLQTGSHFGLEALKITLDPDEKVVGVARLAEKD